ncbi:MAG: hypothetical protein SVJ22_02715 [Halobacteriota archaeon]|nr:hypothetical protein [Halobacteriota archaeon]
MSLSKREKSIDRSLAIPAVIAITLLSTGAASMIYEVALIREFTILLGSSFYSGAIVLSAIMGGLAIGSFLIGRLSDRVKNPFLLLFILEMLIAIISLFIVPVTRGFALSDEWMLTDVIISTFKLVGLSPTSWHILLIYSSGILLIPAILMGGELPVAIKILLKSDTRRIGEVTGFAYFLDTIGGIFGAISAGIIMIPLIGSIRTVHIGGILNTIGATSVAFYIFFLARKMGQGMGKIPYDGPIGEKDLRLKVFLLIAIVLILPALFTWGYLQADELEYTTTLDLYSGQMILDQRQSKFQTITVVEHNILGRVLFLDGKEQISESDDEPYSEALVLPAMVTMLGNRDEPIDVLLIGGGDLGCLEVLTRFSDDDLKSVTLVDLDPEVIEVSKEYFKSIHNDSWKDDRLEYIAMDGRKYVRDAIRNHREYDIIILDLPDPNDDLLATFYSLEFYLELYQLLSEDGIIATQATQADWALGADGFVVIANTLEASDFPVVRMYTQYVPSFGNWGFAIASKRYDPIQMTESDIDDLLEDVDTNTYDGKVHLFLFALPPWLERDINEGLQLINTIDRPIIIREY